MSLSSPSEEPTVSPPSGRPKRVGNDSLWKRARRTLGTDALSFLQPQSKPAGAASEPAAPSKRREQVRHAQRTHRQRTQNYIKTLESEVVRLRESEMRLMEERDKLSAQVTSLKTSLKLNAIPLPAGIEGGSPDETQFLPLSDLDMPATVSYSADNLKHQRLHVDFPDQDNNQGSGYATQKYPMSSPYRHQPQSIPEFPNDFSFPSLNVSSANANPTDFEAFAIVDKIETAIDFVLALEHPCMSHIPYGDPESDDPANHMMMASTPLVARAPKAPQINQQWTTSGSIIKELLNLSSSINLDGEITPVEAWHRLHNHPDSRKLNQNQIEGLKHELSSAVRCCGFGAVLDEQVFWQAFRRFVAAGSPQQAR